MRSRRLSALARCRGTAAVRTPPRPCAASRACPQLRKSARLVVLFHGKPGDDLPAGIKAAAQERRTVDGLPTTVHMPTLPITFGTFHAKFFFLRYSGFLRVAILSGNLIPLDWRQKNQGVWVTLLRRKADCRVVSSARILRFIF